MATIFTILIALVLVGVVEWLLVESGWIPLAPPIKVVIRVVIVLLVAIWILNQLNLWRGPAI